MNTDAPNPQLNANPPIGVDREAFTLAYLATHEAECPACGYNVHRLTQARCPECGRPLAVQVVAATGGFSLPWLMALVALGIAAGFGMLVAVVSLKESLPSWHSEPVLRVTLIYFMCNLPLPAFHLLWRRWFVRQPRGTQWGLALPASIITGLMTLLLLILIWH